MLLFVLCFFLQSPYTVSLFFLPGTAILVVIPACSNSFKICLFTIFPPIFNSSIAFISSRQMFSFSQLTSFSKLDAIKIPDLLIGRSGMIRLYLPRFIDLQFWMIAAVALLNSYRQDMRCRKANLQSLRCSNYRN